HARRSFRGGHVTRQDAHRGRLSRAVGPEKGKYFALVHREGDPLDGSVIAVPFGNFPNFNHVWDVKVRNTLRRSAWHLTDGGARRQVMAGLKKFLICELSGW